MGLDPDVGSHSLFVLLERLSRWQAAYDDLGAKEEALDTAREEADGCRTRLNEALKDYDLGPVEDASEAQEAAATLDTARTEFQEARRDLENAKDKKADAMRIEATSRLRSENSMSVWGWRWELKRSFETWRTGTRATKRQSRINRRPRQS
jgi:uncharacterized membrane protein YccC